MGETVEPLVFVVDDELSIRTALVKGLSRKRYRVHGLESGEALVQALDSQIPDVVLLDLKMPGMGGLQALRAIRQQSPNTVVVLLTAYGTVEEAVEAMKLGAHDFLIKTIDLGQVEAVVGRAVEQASLRHHTETGGRGERGAL